MHSFIRQNLKDTLDVSTNFVCHMAPLRLEKKNLFISYYLLRC